MCGGFRECRGTAFLCDRQPSLGFAMQREIERNKPREGTHTCHPPGLGFLGQPVRRGAKGQPASPKSRVNNKIQPKRMGSGEIERADAAPIVLVENKQRAALTYIRIMTPHQETLPWCLIRHAH